VVAVLALIVVVALSILVVRVGSIAFVMTGLSEDVARFQALSAFSGAGFTTSETEAIVMYPARRRIATMLIRFGSIGLVTSIATLMLSFLSAGGLTWTRLLIMAGGALAVVGLSRTRTFNRLLTPLVKRLLTRYTTLELRDYADLLSLRDDYRIVEFEIKKHTWLADRPVKDLRLTHEGVLVLGVKPPGKAYLGAPPPDVCLRPGDVVILYGRKRRVEAVSLRASGDQAAHREAELEHEHDVRDRERQLEP
jgi:hypothetical protein